MCIRKYIIYKYICTYICVCIGNYVGIGNVGIGNYVVSTRPLKKKVRVIYSV